MVVGCEGDAGMGGVGGANEEGAVPVWRVDRGIDRVLSCLLDDVTALLLLRCTHCACAQSNTQINS